MSKKETAINETNEVTDAIVEAELMAEEAIRAAEPTIGKVVDCGKLRVRKKPGVKADVVCEINKGTEVTIDEKKSSNKWYKVTTKNGAEGFCMKEYIEVI